MATCIALFVSAIPWLVWYTALRNPRFPWWFICLDIVFALGILRLCHLSKLLSSRVASDLNEPDIKEPDIKESDINDNSQESDTHVDPEISYEYTGCYIMPYNNVYQQKYAQTPISYQEGYIPMTTFPVPELNTIYIPINRG